MTPRHAVTSVMIGMALAGVTIGGVRADDEAVGRARVAAADTLVIGGTRFRPESVSVDAAAAALLAPVVDAGETRCTRGHRVGHGVYQGRCTLPTGEDLGIWLLTRGLAEVAAGAPSAYRDAEAEARAAKRGRWGG